MVQFLLTVPGIDPDLYNIQNHTPLITAIINFNMDIMNLLLDFFGEKIQSQMWQLNYTLKLILDMLSDNEESNLNSNKSTNANTNINFNGLRAQRTEQKTK